MRYLIVLLLLIACTKKEDLVYKKGSDYPILGEWKDGKFIPVIPFQPGIYLIVSDHDTASFVVEGDTTSAAPQLLSTYPSCDTIPSNLLKIYLQFSEPMQEFGSSEHVSLIDNSTGDTVRNTFLDLKPELWNDDGTVLTLWVDPGRVKKDLIPNRELGEVFKEHHTYQLHVSKGWKSKKGVATSNNYQRKFITTTRDVEKPDISRWTVDVRNDTVVVNTNETLDWMLICNSLSIDDVGSKTFSEMCERQLLIVTGKPLQRGKHVVRIDGVLEDPAGNNLNRLFETDVTRSSGKSINKDFYSLTFSVN